VADKKAKTSLTQSVARNLLIIYLISLAVLGTAVYLYGKKQVLNEARSKLRLLNGMAIAIHDVVKSELQPHFLKKGEFYPPVISSTVLLKLASEKFLERHPDYLVRVISDNPLDPNDLPRGEEQAILDAVRRENRGLIRTLKVSQNTYMVHAQPIVAEKECMICHYSPESAPRFIVEQYGTKSGYGWKIGEVVGATLVGVQLAPVLTIAFVRTMILAVILGAFFGVIFFAINSFLRRQVVTPVVELTEAAQQISHGKVDKELKTDRTDEIGDLYRAIELLRRSIQVALSRLKR